ncbi:MAG: AAA family ATPase [Candidatus Niyogibacteria bacterium]|nr:AAA family ATPase [Candidatus Niyogibacteria bacterium]
MYLKRLELDGFKSFAKHAVLEFTAKVSCVVGPNGSGKSNVAEAIQWVLGEQSMKSLRGKKGEDLIFAGSSTTPRMSRAGIKLVFDNSERKFKSVDFSEVAVERHVFRDGTNEYFLNGSKVRLKDIVEVLSDVGLGTSQHSIISQGESDRILYASPKERREMIEDALGIKIYQLKRKEAERKLEHTAENMKQVASLRREIQPHLKFLESQVEKAKRALEIRAELKVKLLDYLGREAAALATEEGAVLGKKDAPQKELGVLETELATLKKQLAEEDAGQGERRAAELKLTETRAKLSDCQAKYLNYERELGRLEGTLEAMRRVERKEEYTAVAPQELKIFLDGIRTRLETALASGALEAMSAALSESATTIKSFMAKIVHPAEEAPDTTPLESRSAEINSALLGVKKDEAELQKQAAEIAARLDSATQGLRDMERKIYGLEERAARLKDALRAAEFNEERLRLRREEFTRESEEAVPFLDGEKSASPIWEPSSQIGGMGEFSQIERENLRRAVERLKIRFEEAGGVDSSVVKEFEETKVRDAFFAKELADLESASANLRQIIGELEQKLEHDFEDGIKKINEHFHKFFESMFGGGSASIRLTRPERKKVSEDEEEMVDEEELEKETGVEVVLDLPRKKIKSLEMLSGGERALTSIALLFAMSAVNPPPFLILDETDAALDEANSRRYSAMLLELSHNTQLLVVTHNRETMRSAGALFGVTMGRDGISRLLSVKLEEGEQYAK